MKNILITPEELEQLLTETIQKTITRSLPEIVRKANQKSVFTLAETCELLGITRRSLQHMRDTGQISYVQNGRKIYFTSDDLQAYIDEYRVRRAAQ